jgi:putative transposase
VLQDAPSAQRRSTGVNPDHACARGNGDSPHFRHCRKWGLSPILCGTSTEIFTTFGVTGRLTFTVMPRAARTIVADHCYHVINRGNNRSRTFHEHADFAAFVALMREAQSRVELPILAACLMPNHIHLVVRPKQPGDLACWMHWLFTTHVRHFHARHKTSGRVWQDRFKAFVMQEDSHLLTVIRYVERNAVRAGLVSRAETWAWGSLKWRTSSEPSFQVAPSPIPLPEDWIQYVNQPLTSSELQAIRVSVNRQRPFGADSWSAQLASTLGLHHSLRPIGRPPRAP